LIDLEIENNDEKSEMAISVGLFAEKDLKCFETFIPTVRNFTGSKTNTMKISCMIPSVQLLPGIYYVNVGLYPVNWDFIYDYHWQMHPLQVIGDPGSLSGVVFVAPQWSAP
jgi:lipopolysaccharide transport system ATP-binding protein